MLKNTTAKGNDEMTNQFTYAAQRLPINSSIRQGAGIYRGSRFEMAVYLNEFSTDVNTRWVVEDKGGRETRLSTNALAWLLEDYGVTIADVTAQVGCRA